MLVILLSKRLIERLGFLLSYWQTSPSILMMKKPPLLMSAGAISLSEHRHNLKLSYPILAVLGWLDRMNARFSLIKHKSFLLRFCRYCYYGHYLKTNHATAPWA